MSIEQLLAKYKVQLPNNKEQSDDEESSESDHSTKEDMKSADISIKYLLRKSPNKMVIFKKSKLCFQLMSYCLNFLLIILTAQWYK